MKWFCSAFVVLMCLVSATISANAHNRFAHNATVAPDTSSVRMDKSLEQDNPHRMRTSAYPVQLKISNRSVRIQSEHSQLLPIYRQNGSFYMVMRLSKGVNWLNGLPRGRYFINNKPIAIN